MVHGLPAPARGFVRRLRGVVVPARVVPVDPAVGARRPHHLRNGVRDHAKRCRLAPGEALIVHFGALAARADGWIDWYNARWYDYTAQTPDEASGWGWQAVHHPEDLPKVMLAWPRSIATGEPFEMEFRLRGADGQFRWFLTRATPLRGQASMT